MRSRTTYAPWAIRFTAICLLMTAAAVIAQGQKSTTAINVTSTVYDFGAFAAQMLMRSDDPNGVQASYATIKASKGPGNSVTSQIGTDGKWLLALSNDSGRKLWITPNSPVGNQSAAPPEGYYVIQKAYSACRDGSGNIVSYPNLVNGSGNCSMAVNFFYGGVLYKLLMGPVQPDQGTTCPAGGCPPMGLAKVTCTAVTSSSKCVNWTMEPNADADALRYGVANLYSYTGPKTGPWFFIGQYYNTFRINVSNL